MSRPFRTAAGDQAAGLLMAAGVVTVGNDYLPGSGRLARGVLDLTGACALLLGLTALIVPWRRMSRRAPLVLFPAALALIAVSDRFGGVGTFSYGIYFVVVFVWVGIAQPPRTAWWLAPFAGAAYLAPFLSETRPPTDAISSVTVALPVCVLVAEVLAHSVRRLEDNRRDLRLRIDVVERLARLTSELGSDLDVDAVSRRLVHCACEIFQAEAAIFAAVDGDDVVVNAVSGLPHTLLGLRLPLPETRIAAASEGDEPLIDDELSAPQLPIPAGGSAVTVACRGNRELLGGLVVVFDRPAATVTAETCDVLRLLASQGSAALTNAARHDALRQERAHEHAVVDVLLDGVLVVDGSGVVVSCNRAAAELLGLSVDELIGHRSPIALAAPGVAVEHEIAAGRWVETQSAVLPATGETVVALRDTSRQRALDEAKDLFLATTSHELRTPLTAIKGYVRTLQRRWDVLSDDARRDALATVDEQTDGLIRLTNHLLDGARAGAAGATDRSAVRGAFDLADVVERCVRTTAGATTTHRIVAVVPSSLPTAYGDADATRSALAQLIENAVKYSPAGGEVTVTVDADDDQLAVEVMDRGIGIRIGHEESLFAPFYQAGPTNTREYGGVGLGLYIVRQLVQAQGGEVSARRRPGGGTVMRFTVPRRVLPTQRDGRAHDPRGVS